MHTFTANNTVKSFAYSLDSENWIQVEEDKPAKEQGYYEFSLYDQPEENGISRLLSSEEERGQEQLVNENE